MPAVGDIHLFVLWSQARGAEREIVADISSRFRLLDLVEVTWSAERFARNLTCFYGTDLPPGSNKEQHSGTGPFLVCVVEDDAPRYRPRRSGRTWRWVDTNIVDARARYRRMTGGGYRVHASADPNETARDLALLFGVRTEAFRGRVAPTIPRRVAADIVGAEGWRSRDELLLALEVTATPRVLGPRLGADLTLGIRDTWWVPWVAPGRDLGAGVSELTVAGAPFCLAVVHEPLSLPAARAWLRSRVPPGHHLAVPSARRLVPRAVRRRLRRARRRVADRARRHRRARWGNLRRRTPFSTRYGYDRGTPIDRHYLNRWFESQGPSITGAVLEVKDAAFSGRYGRDVVRIDLVDIDPGNADATVIADLAEPGSLPAAMWDCIVVPQTLQYVRDPGAAVENAWQALRAGGVLLVSVPTVARADPTLADLDRWRFLPRGVEALLAAHCPGAETSVEGFGNLVTSIAYLHGLAAEELDQAELAANDPAYPMLACGWARKPVR